MRKLSSKIVKGQSAAVIQITTGNTIAKKKRNNNDLQNLIYVFFQRNCNKS